MLLMPAIGVGAPCAALLSGAPCMAQAAAAGDDGPAVMEQADDLAAAGKYQQAAVAYGSAAKAFEAQGKNAEQAQALEKSAKMYEKWADQLAKGNTPAVNPAVPAAPETPATTIPAVAPPQQPTANVPIQGGAAPLPLTASSIVNKNARGILAVSAKNGQPVEGVKLSRHDTDVFSPSIAVSPGGTIHVAFVEKHAQAPYELNVYHRSSSDGGRTWSDAKNLSEVMPDYNVGNCQLVIDGAGRVYVIWRTSVSEGFPVDRDPHGNSSNNLVYRVLEGGKWSGKAIPVHPPHTKEDQGWAAASWFVSVDPAGKVHVIWNMPPTQLLNHKILGGHDYITLDPYLGKGRVMEAVLNGQDPGTPREVYMAKVTGAAPYGRACNGFDTINGYVDAEGQAHFVAKLEPTVPNTILLIENGTQKPAIVLPGPVYETWQYPPILLVDAQGRRHIIALYRGGEQPNVRDYLVGSDEEPTVIRASREVTGKLYGFQAYQGPRGRMIVVMQMNDTGTDTDDELYLSTSDGAKWSQPVNVTNNSGRESFFARQTSLASHVAGFTYWYPGPAAAAYDGQGHLVLAYVSVKRSAFESVALGVTLAGGSTAIPTLLFLRF